MDTRVSVAPQSSGGTIVHPQVAAYLDGLQPATDPVLLEIRALGHEDDVPIVHDQVGAFLELLARSHRPRQVVEFGTAIGYSTAWIARGLGAGATLTSFELDEQRHATASAFLHRIDTPATIDLRLGDALQLMHDVHAPVDMAFLDATKGEYAACLDWVLEHMPEGGVVLVDNALMGGHVAGLTGGHWSADDAAGQQAFNDRFVNDGRLHGMVLPIGDGLAFGVRA